MSLRWCATPTASYCQRSTRTATRWTESARLNSAAPLGTYSGWNTRAVGFGHPDTCDLTGQYIPFAIHKADRLASGDPRLSVEERYGSKAGYIATVTEAIQDQLDEGLLLPADAVTILSQENGRNIGIP